MRKLKLIEWIAVAAALLVVSLFVFPTWFASIFFPSNASPAGEAAPTADVATSTNTNTTMQNISTIPGLSVFDIAPGTGAPAISGSQVTVNYVGTLQDGTVFDTSASHGQPFTFTLGAGQVIKGWDEGLLGMKVGGKRELVISPDLGYGDNQVGPIPPGSTLIFQVELVSIK